MKKINKLLIAITFIATTLTANIFAQVESPAFHSNAYKSTANTLRTDTENFIDVRYFDTVKFDKVFATTNLTKTGFNLGFATKKNDYYFAGLYSGGFWYNLEGSNTKFSNDYITNKTDSSKATGNTHRAIFMMGLPNSMGLKLDSYLSFNSSTNKESRTLNQTYNPLVKNINNEYEFNLLWSSNKLDNGKIVLQPWARVGVDMIDHRDVESDKTVGTTYSETVDSITYYNNHYPILNINLGTDIGLKASDKVNQLFGVEYAFTSYLFNKEVSNKKTVHTDNLDSKNSWTEEVKGTRDGRFDIYNTLKGSYKMDFKPLEKLTLATRAGLSVRINSYAYPGTVTTTTRTQNGETTVTKDPSSPATGKDFHIDTTFSSNFGIGLKYAITPSFVLNLGYSGTIPYIQINAHIKDISDSTSSEKLNEVKTTTGSYDSTISTGFSWLMGNCCTLDFAAGISRTPSLEQIWNANWNLGFSFKM